MFTNAAFPLNVHEMHMIVFIKDFSTHLALEMTVAKAFLKIMMVFTKISYNKFMVILRQECHSNKNLKPEALYHSYVMAMFTNAVFPLNVHEMHTIAFIIDFLTSLALEMTVAKAMIHKISYDKFTVILKQK